MSHHLLMIQRLWSTIALVIPALAALAGCETSGDVNSAAGQMVNAKQRQAIYDAGSVLAGTPIQHTFQFYNRTGQRLHLTSQDDIRMSCGCTAANVQAHSLAPGEATPVKVRLNTAGKRGEVTEFVTTSWTTADQRQQEYTFAVRAQIQSALTLIPSEVVFSKDELARGVSKRIECMSDLSLDWSRARLAPLPDGLSIEHRESNGNRLTFVLSCSPSELGESRRGTVHIVVPRSESSATSSQAVNQSLPVYWAAPGSTRISPAVVTFHSTPDKNGWRGWFIVTGDQMKAQDAVHSIEASSAQVEFRERRLTPTAIRVDATMNMIASGVDHRPRWIDIFLSSGERKRLRILCSETHTAKET